jgi:23S rRNA pseudouridine1911/1915/1917 synthase
MEVLWSDHRLVVVNKAPGILAAPGKADPGGRVERGHVPELLRRILHKQGRKIGFMGIIHRLDKDTSGCLILAFDHEAQRMVSEQFSTHSAARTYHALVENHPHGDDGVIRGKQGRRDGRRVLVDEDEPGVEAVTRWKVLKRYPLGTAIEATLETGRTHQIRVALNSLGCPVWGDRVYRDRRWRVPAAQAPRLMLHAHKLAFDHPDDGRRVEVVAPIPPVFGEFAAVLDKPALRTS